MVMQLPDLSVCSGLIVSRFLHRKIGFVVGLPPLNCFQIFDRQSVRRDGGVSQF